MLLVAFVRPVHAQTIGVAAATSSAVPALHEERSLEARRETPAGDRGADDGFLYRYPPQDGLAELGGFLGAVFISDRNSFRDLDYQRQNGTGVIRAFTTFRQPAMELGARGAYFPLAFLGGELEGMLISGETDDDHVTRILGARAQVVVQAPYWSVVPFLVGGVGFWNVSSQALGSDVDPAFHFGGGAKLNVTEAFAVRVDVRDTITNHRGNEPWPHNLEVLGGATVVLGREAPPDEEVTRPPPVAEKCPRPAVVAAAAPAPADMDADGIIDRDDQCPSEPGIAPIGCPDGDKDGFPDRIDGCPTVAGVAPEGCPADVDGDGILATDDHCPRVAETRNGFEDDDGCPDEIPQTVQKFVGVLAGIEFDRDQPGIRPRSEAILANAAAMLAEYPSIHVEIVGHTDSRSSREHNIELSLRRADAVKANLVARGIAPERLRTRGEGPDSPIATNATTEGRQKNRRIEFRIIE